MTSTTHPHESTAPALSVAIELGAKEWLLTISVAPGARRRRARIQPGDRAEWTRVIAGAQVALSVSAASPVRSCYEAGRDGFWPHRWLTQLGVTNLVVDSSSIEVARRARRAKTDRSCCGYCCDTGAGSAACGTWSRFRRANKRMHATRAEA